MSFSQMYEEKVQKFSFLAQYHFKANLYEVTATGFEPTAT